MLIFCDSLFANMWASLGIEGIWAFLSNRLNTWCRGCKNMLCCNSPNFWWILVCFKLVINLVTHKILETQSFYSQGLHFYGVKTHYKWGIFRHLLNSNFHNLKRKTWCVFLRWQDFLKNQVCLPSYYTKGLSAPLGTALNTSICSVVPDNLPLPPIRCLF